MARSRDLATPGDAESPEETARQRLFRGLYFSAQRLRRGVSPDMIRTADALLRCPWPELTSHVERRIQAVHGLSQSGLEWLSSQAPEDRSQVRERMARAAGLARSRNVEWRRTSGSTGSPLSFAKDREMTAWMDAVMWAGYGWHGVRPGQPHARFWGLPRDKWKRMQRRVMDRMLNRRRLDAFELSRETSRDFFRRMRDFRPSYVHAYPTLLRSFVHHCNEQSLNGHDLGVGVVICGGELLVDQTRREISDFFGCKVVDEYGCTESGLLTIECEEGQPHVLPVACYPEVISPNGSSLSEGVGEVVVTDLFGDVAPLVRYRLSDRARIRAPGCRCGRDLPVVIPEMGRSQDFIITPSGRRIYATLLAYTVPEGIARFRAYQVNERLIAAEIVPACEAGALVIRECRRRWERELGGEVEVRGTIVPEIPPEASGKLRYFVPMSDVSRKKRRELLATCHAAEMS